jgi:formamidopyrimidine-DNA glycosylase
MPELPDVVVYCEALNRHYAGHPIERIDLKSPFVVRTFEPDISSAEGKRVRAFRRLGKRIVWDLEGDLLLVLHLMIAGRLHRKPAGTRPKAKTDLVAFHLPSDTLMLTEASPKKRASIYLLASAAELAAHDPGGLDVLTCDRDAFAERLTSENHTLKRALTDPRLLDGIGNAFSDEILHAAQLSPIMWTHRLDDGQLSRLFEAAQHTLTTWIDRLREQTGDGFPEKVTAFRPEMAVHGKFGQPCPTCGTQVARIRYADNETNYCPRCQTGGRLLADRSLSRLLKDDWPRTIDD